jgi:hypothetical protein
VSRELGDLIELAGLAPAEQSRLRRVHELLVAAGPPAELPSALAAAPELLAEVVPLASRRRRPTMALLIAAAVAVACFGSGYVIANEAHQSAVHIVQVHSLAGQRNSFASLRVGSVDSNGNWPMQLTVTGLPQLANAHARYVLMVMQNGKPSALCGTFRVGKVGATTVSFSVPYTITKTTRFVVTEMAPGVQFPGQVVMTSS